MGRSSKQRRTYQMANAKPQAILAASLRFGEGELTYAYRGHSTSIAPTPGCCRLRAGDKVARMANELLFNVEMSRRWDRGSFLWRGLCLGFLFGYLFLAVLPQNTVSIAAMIA